MTAANSGGGKIRRSAQGALAGYATYLVVAWTYIAVVAIASDGMPDTYLPFVWPFMSPFLIFRYSWEGTPLDENLLSLFGGLLLIGAAIWGFFGFPRGKSRENTERRTEF